MWMCILSGYSTWKWLPRCMEIINWKLTIKINKSGMSRSYTYLCKCIQKTRWCALWLRVCDFNTKFKANGKVTGHKKPFGKNSSNMSQIHLDLAVKTIWMWEVNVRHVQTCLSESHNNREAKRDLWPLLLLLKTQLCRWVVHKNILKHLLLIKKIYIYIYSALH